jgi:methionyl-tRNA formyltransferase
LRLVYLGTPEMAVPPLRALVGAGHDLALVVTRADRRRGRGTATSASPVKAAAVDLGLPVSHDVDDVLATGAELGVVVAFGRLIKPHVLAAVPMINVHFSLLPRWRGAAPVERALLAGDEVTGVCVMAVDETLDTGDVYARREVPIGPDATAPDLRAELVDVATGLLVELLAGPLPEPVPQVGEPIYARKIDPAELQLDWHQPAIQLDRWVRVGGAWTKFRGKRLKVHAADVVAAEGGEPGVLAGDVSTVGTGDGSLRLVTVQPEGKAPMTWRDFANGAHPAAGERLG